MSELRHRLRRIRYKCGKFLVWYIVPAIIGIIVSFLLINYRLFKPGI